MHLKELYLKNFRNYREAHVSFAPGINLIQGANAQGKTNLLEAIFLLSTGKSFRSNSLTDLIYHGESHFYIEAHFTRNHVIHTLKIWFDGKQKKIQHDNTQYTSFANLLGLLPSVLFAPEDISLIAGSPSERRRFLNIHIAQTDPLYIHHLIRYAHAMRQRNHLLKQQQETTLSVWEEIMAIASSYLVSKRKQAIEELAHPLLTHMHSLSQGSDLLQIHYDPSFFREGELIEAFRIQFQKQRKREMLLGSTLSGPHRDDLRILISEKEAKLFSSEGQKRSCISALRLAEWERLQQQIGAPPLMCVDDFGTHLDQGRQQLFQKKLGGLGQVFLTSPSPLSISAHNLHVASGAIYK